MTLLAENLPMFDNSSRTANSTILHSDGSQNSAVQEFFLYEWLAECFLSKRELERCGRLDSVRRMPGFVYFLELVGFGRLKIGYTTDVLQRFKKLQFSTSTPGLLRLLCVGYGSRVIERCLHEIFAPRRVFNEWFDFPPEEIHFLIKLRDADAWGMAVLGPLGRVWRIKNP
jgi:hypothetical protein